jgi:hypothetical protein
MVSVIATPLSRADFAFFSFIGGSFSENTTPLSALKRLKAFVATCFSDQTQESQHSLINDFNASVSTPEAPGFSG